MFTKEDSEKLKGLGLDPAKIIEAATSKTEVAITVPSGVFYSDEQLEEIKTNVRDDAKRAANEAAIDLKAKALKAELGIDDPTKDIKRIMELYAAKQIEQAKIEPNAKVQELEQSIKNLQQTAAEKERVAQEYENKLKEREINDKYRSLLPADRNPALTDEEWIARLKSKVEIVNEGGVDYVKDKATGTVIKDKMEKAIPVDKAIGSLFEKEPTWKVSTTPATQNNTHAPRTPSSGKKGLSQEDIMARVKEELPNGNLREKQALFSQYMLEAKA